jgi:release factor glutamine methyltransferase
MGGKFWSVGKLLQRATQILSERGIETPRLDAELLLAHSLGFENRVKLYTEFERPLTEEEVETFRRLVVRRVKGEPVAYITGKKDFYHFTFKVKRGVFIPRPETELLVDVAVERLKKMQGGVVVDVGTGCGCVIITLCKLLGDSYRYIGTDISGTAIELAVENSKLHGCRGLEFVRTNLLDGLNVTATAVVSNPPYVMDAQKESMKANVLDKEPESALFVSDNEPLVFYEQICKYASKALSPDGFLYFEINDMLSNETKSLISTYFSSVELRKDIHGKDRMIKACNGY